MRRDDPGTSETGPGSAWALPAAAGAPGGSRIDIGDLSVGDDGLEITIRWSKTNQEGLGRKVGMAYGGRPRTCPVRAVRDWRDLPLLSEGPPLRPVSRFGKILPTRLTDQSVALIVERGALDAVGSDALCRALSALGARHGGHKGRKRDGPS